MNIGVLGGSFNPPHISHIQISRYCIEKGLCDKVIWVPVNDAYKKSTNIDSKHRVEMVKQALKNEPLIDYSLHELNYNRIVRTLESMEILKKDYSDDNLMFIAGADKLVFKWMQKEAFISQFGYILVNRGDINCDEIINKSEILSKYKSKIRTINYTSDISSTLIREQIKTSGKSEYVSEDVLKYIKDNNLFI